MPVTDSDPLPYWIDEYVKTLVIIEYAAINPKINKNDRDLRSLNNSHLRRLYTFYTPYDRNEIIFKCVSFCRTIRNNYFVLKEYTHNPFFII